MNPSNWDFSANPVYFSLLFTSLLAISNGAPRQLATELLTQLENEKKD
jgi:hypothetical protein